MFVDEHVRLAPSSASVYVRAPLSQLYALQADNPAVLSLVAASETPMSGSTSLALLLGVAALLATGLLAAIAYSLSAQRRLREHGVLGATSRQPTAIVAAVRLVISVVAGVPGAVPRLRPRPSRSAVARAAARA